MATVSSTRVRSVALVKEEEAAAEQQQIKQKQKQTQTDEQLSVVEFFFRLMLPFGLAGCFAIGVAIPLGGLYTLLADPRGASMSIYSIGIFFLYNAMYGGINSLLQIAFYRKQAATYRQWKNQPLVAGSVAESNHSWFPPLVALGVVPQRSTRTKYHWAIVTGNLLLITVSGAIAMELILRGQTNLYPTIYDDNSSNNNNNNDNNDSSNNSSSSSNDDYTFFGRDFTNSLPRSGRWCGDGLTGVVVAALATVVYFAFAEYYWHRAFHIPFLYRHFHKVHHLHKSPEPFDDLYIHPLELVTMQGLMYFPLFAIPQTLASFTVYITIVGLSGILDHCGISVQFGPFDSKDHDGHHKHFRYNYGIITSAVDRIYRTYRHVDQAELVQSLE